jgi:hypothetical protein
MKKTTIWNLSFAALLALGTATFAIADDHGSDGPHHDSSATSGSSGSGQAQPGDDKGGAVEPADDKGNPAPASDDNGGAKDIKIRRKLMPTAAGVMLDASGHFVIRTQGSRQRLQVEAEAMVDDGTILMVFADGNLAGSLTIQMGEGELKLDSEGGDLPEGLDPVTSIKTVTVTDANGNVILQGQV